MKQKSVIIKSIIIIFSIVLLAQVYTHKKTNLTGEIYNREFNQNVVFYPQHQDDEVLWGGSAILRAIETCGRDNVYVVLVSDGLGVNVFKDEAYKNMTKEQKKEIRDKEFKAALRQLCVNEKNIIILEFENNLKNVTHISHHYEYDDHPMHIKNGQVLKNLKDEGKVKDVLYFMKPQYVKFIPEKNRVIYQVNDMSEYNKVKKACYEYKIVDIENGRHGVGYISAHSYFDNLLKSPNLESILSDK